MELRPLAIAFALACFVCVPTVGAKEPPNGCLSDPGSAGILPAPENPPTSRTPHRNVSLSDLNVPVLRATARSAADVIAQAPSQVPQSSTSRRKQLDKLKMATFTKYQAKLLLPVQYQRKDENNQLTAMGADIPHGIFMFMSMRAPDKVPLNAAAIKPILVGTIEGMKAECEVETPLKLGEYEGLECRGKVKVDADVEAIVRGYVADRRMYFVTVMGTGPWIRSSTVKRYLESFAITP